MPSCTEQGQVTCWDGSCQNTYAGCPEVTEGEEGSYVSGGERGPYENPWEDQDVLLGWIYENMGGEGYFDMSQEEFATTYGDEWMEYNPTQAELIYDQLGLLDWAEDVRDEEFEINREGLDLKDRSLMHSLDLARTGAENDLYSTVLQLEGVTRRGRGVRSGEAKKRSARAFSNIEDEYTGAEDETQIKREGVVLDREALDNAYDQSLIDFESRELNLIQDVYALEDQFEENLWAQINQRLANEVYAGTCGGPYDSECENGECIGGVCVDNGDETPPGVSCEDLGDYTCPDGSCAISPGMCEDFIATDDCIPPQVFDPATGGCVDVSEDTTGEVDEFIDNDIDADIVIDDYTSCNESGGIMVDGVCSNDPIHTEAIDWNQVPEGVCDEINGDNCYTLDPQGNLSLTVPFSYLQMILINYGPDFMDSVVDMWNATQDQDDSYGSQCTSDTECGSGMECYVTSTGFGNCTPVSTGGGTYSGPGGPSGATQTSYAGLSGTYGKMGDLGGGGHSGEDECGGCPAGSECLMGTCVNYMA